MISRKYTLSYFVAQDMRHIIPRSFNSIPREGEIWLWRIALRRAGCFGDGRSRIHNRTLSAEYFTIGNCPRLQQRKIRPHRKHRSADLAGEYWRRRLYC